MVFGFGFRTCTLAHYLSLGSSMVRASYRSSEGCGFNPRLGLRNRFSEYRAWRSFNHSSIPRCLSLSWRELSLWRVKSSDVSQSKIIGVLSRWERVHLYAQISFYYSCRFTDVVGLGVGAGANVLTRYAVSKCNTCKCTSIYCNSFCLAPFEKWRMLILNLTQKEKKIDSRPQYWTNIYWDGLINCPLLGIQPQMQAQIIFQCFIWSLIHTRSRSHRVTTVSLS